MAESPPVLYGYWRSSAAYRVRIALNLKQVEVEHRSVHLVRDGGEQHAPAYRRRNPEGLVPLFIDSDGTCLSQSLAIIEYLDETRPGPRLLPEDPVARARSRSLAQVIACEIHPLDNLRVLQYLKRELGVEEPDKLRWYRHWVAQGLAALESRVAEWSTPFSLGERPGLVELCLVPQLYNARRFDCPLDDYPALAALDTRARELEAFARAAPEVQADAVPA
ncbi:maleylacetoacetate isomerase [Modicisalibacter sp. 'Wilcox']|uniref:maleylacetoacetate isomerase n=1 Tax=Modicisalibacter sp. 'Wilcox' TaxID=2679914 RepID=UPI0013D1FDD3|nr:maleylacetoacetate isomerase [Modicisalibacter sp. 'Wilcox']